MSKKLSELIKESPFETKTLGEIAKEIITGSAMSKNSTGNYPLIKIENITANKWGILKDTSHLTKHNFWKKELLINCGDVLVISVSGTKEKIGKSVLYLGSENCIAGGGLYVLKHSLVSKYLIYLLNSPLVKKQIFKLLNKNSIKGGIKSIKVRDLLILELFLPSLQIQNWIGNFLYNLSLLTEKLENTLNEIRERKLERGN